MEQVKVIDPWKTLAIIMSPEKYKTKKDQATCLLPALSEAVGTYQNPSEILSLALSTLLHARQDGLSMTLSPTAF